MTPTTKMATSTLLGVLVAVSFAVTLGTGCAVDGYTRNVEFTHWHDDETLVLVYTRQKTMDAYLVQAFAPQPRTTHVRVCSVQEDNSMVCSHQRRLTNMLNHRISEEVDLTDHWRPRQ